MHADCAHLRCLGALANLPALDLVLARREEVDELDGLEAGRNDLGQRAHSLILQLPELDMKWLNWPPSCSH
jgi:hypothetical protein